MKAIAVTADKTVSLIDIPFPETAQPGHLLVKMLACGINPGDNAFINGVFPKGSIPVSRYDIAGVSGAGVVEQTGSGVPDAWLGKNVAIYRSLKFSDSLIGTWSEHAQIHHQHCVLLPDDVNFEDYAGSLVNIITPYAFLQQCKEEGHQGIIATAGTSATGIAMLGICQAYDFPLISIVRDEKGKRALDPLGAKNILVQTDTDFKQQLAERSKALNTTAVFDGVGGALINEILDAFPQATTIYSYGYLGGFAPLALNLGLLMRKQLVVKSFGNFTSKTVSNPELLDKALAAITGIIHQPHFKTKTGKKFKMQEITEALKFNAADGGKAILYP